METDIPFIKDDLIDDAEKFGGGFFNRKTDLNTLLKIALTENKKEVFADLSFTGKYITGLIKVLNKSQSIPEIENMKQAQKDLFDNINNFVNKLKETISEENEGIKKSFEDEYFILNHQSFENLNKLAEDFDKVKIYLNHLKRE
jgi:predicted transcriptional regulator